MKSIKDIEAVGWGFFGIMAAVLFAPCTYLIWISTFDIATTAGTRIGFGFISATLLAGFTAWGVNSALHQRNMRRYQAEQATLKKNKKKKKKKKHKK